MSKLEERTKYINTWTNNWKEILQNVILFVNMGEQTLWRQWEQEYKTKKEITLTKKWSLNKCEGFGSDPWFSLTWFVLVKALLPSQKHLSHISNKSQHQSGRSLFACSLQSSKKTSLAALTLCFHLSITGRVNFPPTVLAWQLDH